MTTKKSYDYLNRLTKAETLNSFAYTYNDANQRIEVTMGPDRS